MSGFEPDFPSAEIHPSPNFGPRRGVARPDMLILHYTGMESGPLAQAWLADPASEVSCHYLVHEDGRVVQMVREADRAWHAGRSFWHGETDINSRSIGIEIVNPGHGFGYPEFPAAQIDAVIALCANILARIPISPARVLAHSDVAPGRKIDPGEKFPWRRLHRAGVGHLACVPDRGGNAALGPGDRGDDVAALQRRLSAYGYDIPDTGVYDPWTETVVSAFQRHFRPERVTGVADAQTRDILDVLSHLQA